MLWKVTYLYTDKNPCMTPLFAMTVGSFDNLVDIMMSTLCYLIRTKMWAYLLGTAYICYNMEWGGGGRKKVGEKQFLIKLMSTSAKKKFRFLLFGLFQIRVIENIVFFMRVIGHCWYFQLFYGGWVLKLLW